MTSVVARKRKGGRIELARTDGSTVVELRTGRGAEPDEALVHAPEGRWRIGTPEKDAGRKAPRVSPVLDDQGALAASVHSARGQTALLLAGGDSFAYGQTGALGFYRYRLGENLFVARAATLTPGRVFRAEISPVLWEHPARALILGVASYLTHCRIAVQQSLSNGT